MLVKGWWSNYWGTFWDANYWPQAALVVAPPADILQPGIGPRGPKPGRHHSRVTDYFRHPMRTTNYSRHKHRG